MDKREVLQKGSPFGALLGVSSLLIAVLYVAGFAYRWAYYYNFGLQHVVFSLGFQSFLITAIELVRRPGNLMLSLVILIVPLLVLNGCLSLTNRLATRGPSSLRKSVFFLQRAFGLRSALVVDALRAGLIVYTTYVLSSHVGYTTFREHLINSPQNPLPIVTLVFPNGTRPLTCGANLQDDVEVIGDPQKLRELQRSFGTCNNRTRTWRLLYRDESFIYVFASEPADVIAGRRPLTLVLPNTREINLVIN